MADPRIKTIKIKTGVVKRLTKEKVMYEKEAQQQRERVEKFKNDGKDEYEVRKQEEVLQECLMMVPDCQRRLLVAYDDLKGILDNELDLQETAEYITSRAVLDEAKLQLPETDYMAQNNLINSNPNLYMQNYSSSNIPMYNTPSTTTSVPPQQHPNYCRPLLYQQCDPRFKSNNQSSSSAAADALDKKTDDELWIETYLSKIGKINLSLQSNIEIITKKPTPLSKLQNKKCLKIHVAKSLLHRCIKLLEELEKLEDYLRVNVATISSAEWKEKTIEIGQQKDEFTALLSQFDDSSVLDQLKKTLNKRKRKRISQKRKKVARKEEYAETLKNRQLVHKAIDQWLENMKTDVETAKKEELAKKDADCILAEVTKKKSDARKQLNILSSLVKLRAVREQAALQRGEKVSLDDSNAFKTNTEKLQKMWEDALKTYCEEEQTLRATLQTDNEEVDSTVIKNQQIIEEWKTLLFGSSNFIPSETYWALTVAEKNLGTFIAIRKSWDTFLVSKDDENGSRIPIGWVIPDSNSTEWSKYIRGGSFNL